MKEAQPGIHNETQKESHKKFLPLFIAIPGICIVAAIFFLKPQPKPNQHQLAENPKPKVEIAHIRPESVKLEAYSQGTVSPRREIDLVAQVAGQIVKVEEDFIAGGFFKKNSALIYIDDRDYQSAVARARSQVANAKQGLAEEKGRARQARSEWRDLGNNEANDLFLRKPQLAAAEAAYSAAVADLQQAEVNLQRTKITVPFTGRVRETYVDLGQYVSPGTPVANIYDASVAQVRLPLNDRQAALVNLPLTGKIDSQHHPKVNLKGVIAGKSYEWQGSITRAEATIDTRSRMYYAIAEIDNPFNYGQMSHSFPLIMGLFVEAEIEGQEIDDVLVLPRTALFKRDKIYSLDKNNRVEMQSVQVLQTNDTHAWVRAQLDESTPLVTSKISLLTPGTEVSPLESTQPSSTNQAAPVAQQQEQ